MGRIFRTWISEIGTNDGSEEDGELPPYGVRYNASIRR